MQSSTALVATPGTANRSALSGRFQGKTGLILVNIGTPASLNVADVREYLRAFLGDDRVVDIRPKWLKALLLEVLLLTRPAKSAEAYANIWDAKNGSPLLYYSKELAAKLQKRLGDGYAVAVGMQFGEPNLVSAMRDFRQRGIDRIIILPLFPQYASSTTGSASEMAYRAASVLYSTPYLHVVPAFYDHPAYIRSYARVIEQVIGPCGSRRVDHVLLSFHGVPETHCQRTDDTGLVCMRQEQCCGSLVQANRNCYRAQCFATARALAKELSLAPHEYTVSFQSRLTAAGPEWIKPYTDEMLAFLPKERGIRRLAVAIPSFVTDCLETLEEIGMEGRETFLHAGGEEFFLVPCLNDSHEWADSLLRIVEDSC
jgi:ferrochelatase